MAKSHFGHGRASSLMGFGGFGGGPALPHGIPVSNAPGYDQNLALSGQLLAQMKQARRQPVAPAAAPVARPAAPSPQDLYNSQAGAREAARQALAQLQDRSAEAKQKHDYDMELERERQRGRGDLLTNKQTFEGDQKTQDRALKETATNLKNERDQAHLQAWKDVQSGKKTLDQAKFDAQQADRVFDQKMKIAGLTQKSENDGTHTPAMPEPVNAQNTLGSSPKVAPEQGAPAAQKPVQDAPAISGGYGAPTPAAAPVQQLNRDGSGDGDFTPATTPTPPPVAQSNAAMPPPPNGATSATGKPKLERDMERRNTEKDSEEDQRVKKQIDAFNTQRVGKSNLDQINDIGYEQALLQGLPANWQQNPRIRAMMQPVQGSNGGLGLTTRIANAVLGTEKDPTATTWNTETNHKRALLIGALGGEGAANKYAAALDQRAKELAADPAARAFPDPDAATEATRSYQQYLKDKKAQDDAFAAEEGAKNAPGAFTRFGRSFVKPFEAIPETITHLPEAAAHAVGADALMNAKTPQQAAAAYLQKVVLDPTGAGDVVKPIADQAKQGDIAGALGNTAGQAAQMMLMNKLTGVAPELNNPVASRIVGAGERLSRMGGRGWAGLPGRVLKEAGDFLSMPEKPVEPVEPTSSMHPDEVKAWKNLGLTDAEIAQKAAQQASLKPTPKPAAPAENPVKSVDIPFEEPVAEPATAQTDYDIERAKYQDMMKGKMSADQAGADYDSFAGKKSAGAAPTVETPEAAPPTTAGTAVDAADAAKQALEQIDPKVAAKEMNPDVQRANNRRAFGFDNEAALDKHIQEGLDQSTALSDVDSFDKNMGDIDWKALEEAETPAQKLEPITDENTPDGMYNAPKPGSMFTPEWDAKLPNKYGGNQVLSQPVNPGTSEWEMGDSFGDSDIADPSTTKTMSPSEQMAFHKSPTVAMSPVTPQPFDPGASWWGNLMNDSNMFK